MDFVSKDAAGKYAEYEGEYYHNGILLGRIEIAEPQGKESKYTIYVYDVNFNLKSVSHSNIANAYKYAVRMIEETAKDYINLDFEALGRILVKPAALARELNLIPATIYAQAGKKLTAVELGATENKPGDIYIVRDLKLHDYVGDLRASGRRVG